MNKPLLEKANKIFESLTREDLPAYITRIWVQTIRVAIKDRATDTLPNYLGDLSEGPAEVFCLTDPSKADNPIIFASKEFHKMTQVIWNELHLGPKLDTMNWHQGTSAHLANIASAAPPANFGVTKMDIYGKGRWIHTTPLFGSNGAIGVWMAALINDDEEAIPRRTRDARPVNSSINRPRPFVEDTLSIPWSLRHE
ncbi:hypothetical protein F4776DRAFT_672847 [Hypoxylon sp. NC0597]|nr:hypothetical protein F4776DRAFT_672847 [Hypoxylon sp. NC0597]